MYPNVRAEIARNKLTLKVIAEQMGLALGTLSGKLNGKYPVTLNEAKQLKIILKSALSIEELFETEGS